MCRMCTNNNYQEVMMDGEVACEVALKIAAKYKSDRLASSDEENHEDGKSSADKTREEKEVKSDKVASNIVGILSDKNSAEKANEENKVKNDEVEKKTEIVSSKDEKKKRDKNSAEISKEEKEKKKEKLKIKTEGEIKKDENNTEKAKEDKDKKSEKVVEKTESVSSIEEKIKGDEIIAEGTKEGKKEKSVKVENKTEGVALSEENVKGDKNSTENPIEHKKKDKPKKHRNDGGWLLAPTDRKNKRDKHERDKGREEKKVDILKTGLPEEAKQKWLHCETEGWHPPKAAPGRKVYAASADILEETPREDQTWYEPQTFYPTLEEFANLTKYIKYMETQGAARAGIAKIVAPKEWVPRRIGYNPADMEEIEIKPVQQDISLSGAVGAFKTLADRSRPEISVDGYRRLAISNKYGTPAHNTYEELEELYWTENMDDKAAAPIYGADTLCSITDEDQEVCNIPKLDSLLNRFMKEKIPGVNMPYVYFGMWKATFSWHVEDMDLYALNYIHYGAPKTWYCIPPQFGYQLEQVAQKLFPDFSSSCFNLMRHKAIMIGPKLLEANGVRVQKMVQEQRNMIVVFPHAYHSGFNHGFNMAESANFAAERWVEYGKRFRDCVCRDQDAEVKIQMEPFVKEVQPEKYRAWRNGKDFALHPEDPWYMRRCLQDAIVRLKRNEIDFHEFEQLKIDLRRKREIPKWFKERFIVDYDDQRQIETDTASFYKKEEKTELLVSPRVKAAKRRLEEMCEEGKLELDIKIKKLRRNTMEIYRTEMETYNKMLEDEIAIIEEKKAEIAAMHESGAFGKGQAKGVGFAGANEQELLEQKANVTCKANKNHRFKACLKCSGCRTENCGDCMHCHDMPKFGGMGTMKQKCMLRICVNPQLRTCEHCVWNL